MNRKMQNRILEEANYIINTNDTIRGAAKKFNLSKSTIHKDLKYKIPIIDKGLLEKLEIIFKAHNNERHINGGLSTLKKYRGI